MACQEHREAGAHFRLQRYLTTYNHERPHQSLAYQVPTKYSDAQIRAYLKRLS
jgi:transposase InsO family protein